MSLRAKRTFTVESQLPPRLEPLREIAWNLFWTWNTDAAALFSRIDADLWEVTFHNPVRFLNELPKDVLERLVHDEDLLARLDRAHDVLKSYLHREPQVTVPATDELAVIAYFSLEFALTESLQSYSGGLGVLAGDHLKSASDLGLPLVGVGLFYQQGYFQQVLSPEGWQGEEYSEIDSAWHPLRRIKGEDGLPLEVAVQMAGHDVIANVWRIDVGQIKLFLLDSDNPKNSAADRGISGRLYGGDVEMRIQQEILLGIGGVRALRALGYQPAVCHMNEGHSALLGVDRIRTLMEETGASFDEARLPVSAATVFTTHTAVAAGIDLFPPELMRKYLASYYEAMGIDERTFLGLGRINSHDDHEPFSMALLGLRLSGFRNGVSKLHGTVSRKLWSAAWPDLPQEEIPIDSVTNGVHLPTWVGHDMAHVYDSFAGEHWRDDPTDRTSWARLHDAPEWEIWHSHERQKSRLIARVREQSRAFSAQRGLSLDGSAASDAPLEPGALTVGFARRFAGYKRATLLFRDLDRLQRIVSHPSRPVQFIFAGKAHPRDEPAKQLIREVVEVSRRPEFRGKLVVLERYDVDLARALVQGCDIWLNTPLRPLEASGTSGMKATANGALHMSVLDGWWAEAYRPGLGWAVGRDRIDDDPEVQDAFDAESVYDLLEHEAAELYYDRGEGGIPWEWVRRMRGSIAAYSPEFNTNRMVRDYAEKAYGPAAEHWARLREGSLAPSRALAAWLTTVRANWGGVQVVSVEDDTTSGSSATLPVSVRAHVRLGALTPKDCTVQIAFGPAGPTGNSDLSQVAPMQFEGESDGVLRYSGLIEPQFGGRVGYAVRILPSHADLNNPLDTGLVCWS
ncbi:hypothetical protein AYO38_02235 [bacterium SCGC AG-212-C10]|nr:hypothetical protein AYO38_02235 [bacterium SCGC AG-212-C10]